MMSCTQCVPSHSPSEEGMGGSDSMSSANLVLALQGATICASKGRQVRKCCYLRTGQPNPARSSFCTPGSGPALYQAASRYSSPLQVPGNGLVGLGLHMGLLWQQDWTNNWLQQLDFGPPHSLWDKGICPQSELSN